MSTITKEINISGKGLISGKDADIVIKPSVKNTGILFFKQGTGEFFPVKTDYILDTKHAIVLGNSDFIVKLPEHLLATISLLGIKDLEIHLSTDEIPICDGSSKTYYDHLKELVPQVDVNNIKYQLNKPLFYNHKHTSIVAIPHDSFKITYAVNYVRSPFSYSWYSWDVREDDSEEIINARTFGYMKDLPLYQSQGMALGVTLENTIGLKEDGTLTTKLRYDNEPIRHKILDLVGDLFLTGLNPNELNAHFIAIETGHYQHCEMAKLIRSEFNI